MGLVDLSHSKFDLPTVSADHAALVRCAQRAASGYYAEALAELAEVMRDADQTGDLATSASALFQAAWCCTRIGKVDAGLDCIQEARRQWLRHGNVGETARTMALESLLLLDVGLIDEGYEEAEQAIATAETAGDASILAFARNAQSCILAVCGQPALARQLVEAAIKTVASTGDDHAYALYHLNLGFIHFKQFEAAEQAGRTDEAAHHLDNAISVSQQAAELAADAGDVWTQRAAIANAAELNARAGHLSKASTLILEWEDVAGRASVSGQIHYLYTLGDILMRQGDHTKAKLVCEQALALAEANNQVDHMVNTTEKLADIHAALGAHDAAFAVHKKFHALHVKQTGETARRRANTSALRRQTAEWQQKASQFEDQALRDPLTGIANRRQFDNTLDDLAGQRLTLGILDLDHFKAVNDAHTHMIGDEVLKRVSQVLVDAMGDNGLVARLGGEEFGLIFSGATLNAATARLSELRGALAAVDWTDIADGLDITASIGLAAGDGDADIRVLMATADSRLYTAKHQGRDRVVTTDHDEEPKLHSDAG